MKNSFKNYGVILLAVVVVFSFSPIGVESLRGADEPPECSSCGNDCCYSGEHCCKDAGEEEDNYCCDDDQSCCGGSCCGGECCSKTTGGGGGRGGSSSGGSGSTTYNCCTGANKYCCNEECSECKTNTQCAEKYDDCYTCNKSSTPCHCECGVEEISVSGPDLICPGMEATFRATGSFPGTDCISWSGGGEPSSQEGGETFTTEWDSAGSKTVTASSTCNGISDQKSLDVVDITSVDGPDKVCPGRSATFTVETNPEGHGECVKWETKNGVETGTGSTFTTSWSYNYWEPSLPWGKVTRVFAGSRYTESIYHGPYKYKSVTIGYYNFSSYEQIANCPDHLQHPTKNFIKDGCSPFFTPDDPTKLLFNSLCQHTSFTGVCNDHDECYQTCDSSRSTCDVGLCGGMNGVCNDLTGPNRVLCRIPCLGFSATYCDVVKAWGNSAWEGDQVQFCVCCEEI